MATKNNRYKNCKIITFTEDFQISRSGKAKITKHKKGTSIMAHAKVAENLKEAGVKATFKDFDYEGHAEKQAIKLEKMKAKK